MIKLNVANEGQWQKISHTKKFSYSIHMPNKTQKYCKSISQLLRYAVL